MPSNPTLQPIEPNDYYMLFGIGQDNKIHELYAHADESKVREKLDLYRWVRTETNWQIDPPIKRLDLLRVIVLERVNYPKTEEGQS